MRARLLRTFCPYTRLLTERRTRISGRHVYRQTALLSFVNFVISRSQNTCEVRSKCPDVFFSAHFVGKSSFTQVAAPWNIFSFSVQALLEMQHAVLIFLFASDMRIHLHIYTNKSHIFKIKAVLASFHLPFLFVWPSSRCQCSAGFQWGFNCRMDTQNKS